MSLCGDSLEAAGDRTNIIDNFPMAGPDQTNCLWGAYPSRARVPCWTKPVILRGPCGPGPDARIGGAIDRVCQHLQEPDNHSWRRFTTLTLPDPILAFRYTLCSPI